MTDIKSYILTCHLDNTKLVSKRFIWKTSVPICQSCEMCRGFGNSRSYTCWSRISDAAAKYIQISQGSMIASRSPRGQWVKSLAHGRSGCDSKYGVSNLVLLISIFRCYHDNDFRRMPQDLTDDKSTLFQAMAWCCQATSHYLSQCLLRSLSS